MYGSSNTSQTTNTLDKKRGMHSETQRAFSRRPSVQMGKVQMYVTSMSPYHCVVGMLKSRIASIADSYFHLLKQHIFPHSFRTNNWHQRDFRQRANRKHNIVRLQKINVTQVCPARWICHIAFRCHPSHPRCRHCIGTISFKNHQKFIPTRRRISRKPKVTC